MSKNNAFKFLLRSRIDNQSCRKHRKITIIGNNADHADFVILLLRDRQNDGTFSVLRPLRRGLIGHDSPSCSVKQRESWPFLLFMSLAVFVTYQVLLPKNTKRLEKLPYRQHSLQTNTGIGGDGFINDDLIDRRTGGNVFKDVAQVGQSRL